MKFYRELPAGYRTVKEIDAVGNKKFAVWMNLAALPLMLVSGAAAWLLRFSGETLVLDDLMSLSLSGLALCVGILVYLVLHELTHGLVYRLLTGEKLSFGLSWSCAWCGVPDIYVTRKTALCALLAPFVLFNAVFAVLIALCSGLAAAVCIVLFSIHFGGCAGDLYDTYLLLFRLRGDILMRDTGPKQTFYQKMQ